MLLMIQNRLGIYKKKKYLVSGPSNRSKVYRLIECFKMVFEQFIIFVKEYPDVIVTTGAGFVIPTCVFARLFRKKVIYIETFAKMNEPSKAGVFIYKYNIANLFLVQHKKCLEYYPKAVYGGWIY
ncbi:PssD/Cps14F family polysaccharide biosynthesis glycosyltransferase [Bacillus coahuilensis]|uniref:PssD/Cps14F family polysaccharide biosynthesis glycosyltransferase n=1 Tax=Bacillus coahuilensis TaxID=408580 RepID=UPI00307ACB47